MNYNDAPEYLKSADLHNVGAGTDSFFSDPLGKTSDFVGAIPAFAVTSIASGINSIYNSGVVAGNFFGITDAQENDLQTTLGSYDANLAQYYEEHKSLADVSGFIVSSFIPGIAGVKLLNVGQRALSGAMKTGSMGRTLAEATGLIPTRLADGKTLATIAGEGLALGQQTFTLANAGVLKAIAGGVTQATLEAAAFETMVQATMFRSPILEGQDIKDIGSNVLLGGVLGGVIGGAINSAKVYGDIKKVLTATDTRVNPYRARSSDFGLTEESDKMVLRAFDLDRIPAATDNLTKAVAEKTVTNIRQDIRTGFHGLVGKDEAEFGNQLADLTEAMGANQISNIVAGAKLITRAGYEITPAEGQVVAYTKLHGVPGDGIGDISFSPISKADLNLADSLPTVKGKSTRANIDSYVQAAGNKWKSEVWL